MSDKYSLKVRLQNQINTNFLKSPSLLWCLTCIFLVTLILYWRRPDVFYNPQFWAEDGSVFFANNYFDRTLSLFETYAGYFHVLARFTAFIGGLLPIRFVPHWYSFASWLLLVAIVIYLFSNRFSLRNSQKFLMSLALVANTADNEVFFNIANWATLTSFFWLLLAISVEPKNIKQSVFDFMLLTLAGLNSPFVICLWLLFLLRLKINPTRHNSLLFILSIIIAILQIWHMINRTKGEFEIN